MINETLRDFVVSKFWAAWFRVGWIATENHEIETWIMIRERENMEESFKKSFLKS